MTSQFFLMISVLDEHWNTFFNKYWFCFLWNFQHVISMCFPKLISIYWEVNYLLEKITILIFSFRFSYIGLVWQPFFSISWNSTFYITFMKFSRMLTVIYQRLRSKNEIEAVFFLSSSSALKCKWRLKRNLFFLIC